MSDKDIVSIVRSHLAERLGRERFELWFGPSTRLRLCDGKLLVETANQFAQDWLRRHYRRAIEDSVQAVVGNAVAVEFIIDPALAPTQKNGASKTNSATDCSWRVRDSSAEAKPQAPGIRAGLSQCRQDAGLVTISAAAMHANDHSRGHVTGRADAVDGAPRRRFATLPSFVVGAANRLAHASAMMVAERPGSLTPFLVYGPPGTGKTHLLEGIWSAVRMQSHRQPVYLSAEQFTTLFVEALRGSGLPNFRRKYRCVDILLIDDLQFLTGKRATLVELLHTIDALLREGRQLVFAADRPPAELHGLGPELTTRLAGGMVCQLEPPDSPMRFGLVHQFAQRMKFQLSDDVAQLVATQITAGTRELAGVVNRLHAASRMLGCAIDRTLAEQTLSEMLSYGARAVRLNDIERAVCDVFGLSKDSLQSQRRGKHISAARMLAMWLARKHTRAGLAEIGQHFGRRSHSTVISAQKRVADWMLQQTAVELSDSKCQVDEAVRRVEARLRAG